MEYARVVTEDGISYTSNYILDEVLDTLNAYGISNEDEKNDELIIRLTIEKFEYARRCISQLYSQCNLSKNDVNYRKLEDAIKCQIVDLGGKPREIK